MVLATQALRPETHRKSSLRIRAIRQALGMRQIELAFYLHVSQNTVSNWETGRSLPSGLAHQAIRNLCAEHGFDPVNMRRFG
jgi:DNA-binding transcriptional regulator YiaG